MLGSVLIERFRGECWQGSLSAFYYTPVQALFVVALSVVGTSLIVIRGSTEWEDTWLKVSGALAIVVALVPTAPEEPNCSSVVVVPKDPDVALAYVDNNLLALAAGLVISMVVVTLVGRGRSGGSGGSSGRSGSSAFFSAAITVVLLVAGLVWYWVSQDTFVEYAHGYAAVGLFLGMWIVVVMNARSSPSSSFRMIYWVVAGLMVVASVAIVATGRFVEWNHQVLVIEIVDFSLLAGFWLAQTVEFWNGGVATGKERIQRQEDARLLRTRSE
jgi:hypothetical protein